MNHLLRHKPLLAAAAGIVLAALGIAAMAPDTSRTSPPSPPPANPFARAVAAAGLVEPATENVSIGTPIAGIIDTVHAKPGQILRAGDPLFAIETRHLDAELAVRRAEAAVAKARQATQAEILRDLEDQLTRIAKLDSSRVVSTGEANRTKFARNAAAARLDEASREVDAATARCAETEVQIARSTVKSPIDGRVLRVNVRAGEFAQTGGGSEPLMVIGGGDTLHVRAEFDETDAGRVAPTNRAHALLRGGDGSEIPLEFVRFEPWVIPKRSLTGDVTERVDTRVLQVIYRLPPGEIPGLIVGRQVDVFIEQADTLARSH